jgi:hypothetical protein
VVRAAQNVISAVERRRAELVDQLDVVRGAVTRHWDDLPVLDELAPIVCGGVDVQLERLKNLPVKVAQRWPIMRDVGLAADRLASDALAFFGGAAVRRLGLDDGACDIADALLQQIAKQVRVEQTFVTLPSSGEYIDILSEVVRIRYPGDGIWDLPVAIHEFGHFLLPRFGVRCGRPAQTIIDRAPTKQLASFAEELWCDVFATYVGGPAYGFSLAARLDPTRPHKDLPTHPSAATRMAAVMHTIAALQEAWQRKRRATGSLAELSAAVWTLWTERVESTGQQVGPNDAERERGAGLATQVVPLLDADEGCLSARFDDATESSAVDAALDSGTSLDPARSMLAVINGGWMARRRQERANRRDEVDRMTREVSTACQTISTQRP